MKSKFLILMLLGLSLTATAQQQFTINGKTGAELNGKQIYLVYNQSGKELLDSTLVSEGRFLMAGTVARPVYGRISVKDNHGKLDELLAVYLENGAIHASLVEGTVGGTPVNEQWNGYLKVAYPLHMQLDTIGKEYDALSAQQSDIKKAGGTLTLQDTLDIRNMLRKYNNVISSIEKAAIQFIKNHTQEDVSTYLMGRYFRQLTIKEVNEIMDNPSPSLREMPWYQDMLKHFEGVRRAAVGAKYTDLVMENPDGKAVRLSDFIGKHRLVLVDFWASWCGPCRAEMPNVIAAYEQFKDKGLEIVGVSFDSKKDAWVQSIEKQGMKWPQMSDLKGWQSAAAGIYAIKGIPASLLIDRDGTIVAKDLRGNALGEKLAELLK